MRFIKILSLMGLVVLLTQCYPDGPETYEELDIVFSSYDPEYNFAAKQTFAMPDKIMKIDDDLINGDGPNYVNDVYANSMLAKIRENMLKYGWVEKNISDTPNVDVLIAPAAYELTTYFYYDYWYYYDWWYGGYYPPGGWYYPYPVVEGYTTGSLVIAMVDPNDLTASDRPRVAWTAIVNGLLEGSTADFTSRMNKAINQAFTQSQYLKK